MHSADSACVLAQHGCHLRRRHLQPYEQTYMIFKFRHSAQAKQLIGKTRTDWFQLLLYLLPVLQPDHLAGSDTPAQRSKSVSGALTASQKAKNCQSERHLLTVRTAKTVSTMPANLRFHTKIAHRNALSHNSHCPLWAV